MESLETTLPKVEISFNPQRDLHKQIYVRSSHDAFKVCLSIWKLDTIDLYEEFKVLFLDRRNGIIGYRDLSRGSSSGTVVDIRIILSIAILSNSSGLILVHNHPSGMTDPSYSDKRITEKMVNAACFFELKILDHLVITRTTYTSFRDEGLL